MRAMCILCLVCTRSVCVVMQRLHIVYGKAHVKTDSQASSAVIIHNDLYMLCDNPGHSAFLLAAAEVLMAAVRTHSYS
jgi:hypothetical protein